MDFVPKYFPAEAPSPEPALPRRASPERGGCPRSAGDGAPRESGEGAESKPCTRRQPWALNTQAESAELSLPPFPLETPRSGAHPGEVRIQRAWPQSEPVLGCRMRPAAAPCFLCCIFSPPEFGFVCVSAGFSPAFASRAVTAQMVAERLSTPWRGTGSVAGLEAV